MEKIPDDNISAQFILSLFDDDAEKLIVKDLIAGVAATSIVDTIVQSLCEGKND